MTAATSHAAQPAWQGTASGYFSIDGKKVALKYAYAMLQENTFDSNAIDTAVLLTSAPLPEKALKTQQLEFAMDKSIPSILYVAEKSGKTTYEAIAYSSLQGGWQQFSGVTNGAVKFKKRSETAVQGSIDMSPDRFPSADEFFGFAYRVKAEFDAPVLASTKAPRLSAATAAPLPKDGGEPGKAYLAYVQAVCKGDLNTIKLLLDNDLSDASEKEIQMILAMEKSTVSKGVKIDKGFAKGDDATLFVTGKGDDEVSYGTVLMHFNGKNWIVGDVHWSDKPHKGK